MWIRVDDQFDEHPKLARVGPLGIALWLAGLAYCNRNLTDGFIPWAVAQRLLPLRFVETREDGRERVWEVNLTSGMLGCGADETQEITVRLLVANGVWDQVEGGYRVHDYLDYQPSKRDVLASRKGAAQRVAASRDRKRNGAGNGVTGPLVTASPSPSLLPTHEEPPTAPGVASQRATSIEAEGDPRAARAAHDLVLGIAGVIGRPAVTDMTVRAPVAPRRRERMNVDRVWAICKHLGKERGATCIAVMQRLFNAGVRRDDILEAAARRYVERVATIRNPWAYFSPGGEGFAYLETEINAKRAIEEHEAIKRADAAWLSRGKAVNG